MNVKNVRGQCSSIVPIKKLLEFRFQTKREPYVQDYFKLERYLPFYVGIEQISCTCTANNAPQVATGTRWLSTNDHKTVHERSSERRVS